MECPRQKITSKAYGSLKTLTLIKRFLPYHLRKQLAESLVLSQLDYGDVLYLNAPAYLHQQLQRIQNTTASFVRGHYLKLSDVVALEVVTDGRTLRIQYG